MIITKKIKSNGYTAYEHWDFHKTIGSNRMVAIHYINNRKGTFYQKLGDVWFETKDEGNNFFLKKLEEGFERA